MGERVCNDERACGLRREASSLEDAAADQSPDQAWRVARMKTEAGIVRELRRHRVAFTAAVVGLICAVVLLTAAAFWLDMPWWPALPMSAILAIAMTPRNRTRR